MWSGWRVHSSPGESAKATASRSSARIVPNGRSLTSPFSSLGAVTVPIYSTQTAEQTAFILNDSGARVIAVSTAGATGKGAGNPAATFRFERILVMDAVETAHAVQMQRLMLQGPDCI